MKKITIATTLLLLLTGPALAGHYNHDDEAPNYSARHDLYEFAKVIRVEPNYREHRVSVPVRECVDEPIYHTHKRQPKSAGGMLAGGVIGGIIGHQVGTGRHRGFATAVGTLIGAQIGHEAVNGSLEYDYQHDSHEKIGVERHCQTRFQSSYEQVVDGYDVTYRYRGQRYRVRMPYDPGKRIKLRVQFAPVI